MKLEEVLTEDERLDLWAEMMALSTAMQEYCDWWWRLDTGLRGAIREEGERRGWKLHIPPFRFTTDNAAMIGITGYYRYLSGQFASDEIAPMARMYF